MLADSEIYFKAQIIQLYIWHDSEKCPVSKRHDIFSYAISKGYFGEMNVGGRDSNTW